MSVYNALKEYSPMIVDESTTKTLEEDMDKIAKGEKSDREVIEEGKQMLLSALQVFDKNKAQIALAMSKVLQENEMYTRKVPDGRRRPSGQEIEDGQDHSLHARTIRNARHLLAAAGREDRADRASICEHCHTPIIKVIRQHRGVFEMCLDSKCITKAGWKSREAKGKPAAKEAQNIKAHTALEIKKKTEKGAKTQVTQKPSANAQIPQKPGTTAQTQVTQKPTNTQIPQKPGTTAQTQVTQKPTNTNAQIPQTQNAKEAHAAASRTAKQKQRKAKAKKITKSRSAKS